MIMVGFWRSLRDGLSSFGSSQSSLSRPEASIPIAAQGEPEVKPERTIVYMRSTETPASFWEDEVRYDAWGVPYIRGYGNREYPWGDTSLAVVLKADGSTSATWMYGTKWKHKSGPPVRFGEAPKDPFASGTPTRRAETTGSVAEGDGGPTPKG